MGDVTDDHSSMAKWAVGLAVAAIGVVGVGLVLLALGLAFAGNGSATDTWVGAWGADVVGLGLLPSSLGFAAALAVRTKHESWARLWLPLAVFPVLAAVLGLGQAFLWG